VRTGGGGGDLDGVWWVYGCSAWQLLSLVSCV